MDISLNDVEDFRAIFQGNQQAHGIFIPFKENVEGKKIEGKAATANEYVSASLYEKHLKGEQGLGIVPIRQDGTCSFAVIDVDKYDSSCNDIVRAIYKHNLPLVPFRSKSGGLHLYLFLEITTQAKQVVKVMNHFRRLFSLKKDTEIFPKQTTLKEGDSGNWINLPYFNMEDTKQYLIDEDLSPVNLNMAIQIVKTKKVLPERFSKLTEELPLSDAPPCLQSIYILGNIDHDRNLYLFSLARYYKAKEGDDFEYAVAAANNELASPITLDELSSTVIKAHKKKNYSYKCKEEPICSICDKIECKLRKYGIGGAEVSDVSYEEFIQYGTEEPYYEWIINGAPLTFFSEADIINQMKFRELCVRKLHLLPFKQTDFNWTGIVNTALHNVIIKDEEEKSGMSMSSAQLFREYLIEFLTKRAPAANVEQILVDRVYRDTVEGGYIFKPKNLHVFLVQQKQFRAYSLQQMSEKLKSMGAYPKQYYVSTKKTTVRVWIAPFTGLEKYIETVPEDIEIDFLDEVKNEDY